MPRFELHTEFSFTWWGRSSWNLHFNLEVLRTNHFMNICRVYYELNESWRKTNVEKLTGVLDYRDCCRTAWIKWDCGGCNDDCLHFVCNLLDSLRGQSVDWTFNDCGLVDLDLVVNAGFRKNVKVLADSSLKVMTLGLTSESKRSVLDL